MLALLARRLGMLALSLLVGLGTLVALPQPARSAEPAALESTSISMKFGPTMAVLHAGNPPGAEVTIEVAGGGAPDGDVQLVVDGQVAATRKARRTTYIGAPTDTLGPHTVVARYLGSTTQAPSETDAPATYTVTKADTAVTIYRDHEFETTPDDAIPFEVLPQDSGADLTEPVTVSEGGVELATIALDTYFGELPLADLPLGRHTLRFDYPGDDGTNASHAMISFTITKVRPFFVLSIGVDKFINFAGGDPVTATVSIEQAAGESVDPTGEIEFYLDDELFGSRPVTDDPITFEFPVDDIGFHTISAVMEGTDEYDGNGASWGYHVVKAPTRVVTDTTHPYPRTGSLPIAVESDGGPVEDGTVSIRLGEQSILLELTDGRTVLPLEQFGTGVEHLTLEYWGDDLHEESRARIEVRIVPVDGDTRIHGTVDRADPVVGGEPVTATLSVDVEGGATPQGVFELEQIFGGPVTTLDASHGPATVKIPPARVGDRTQVRFLPSDPSQRPSYLTLDYRVRKAATETRVKAPATPLAAGDRLPVTIATLDSSVAPFGTVLVTDGEPTDCVWPDPIEDPYDPPVCANALTLLDVVDGRTELELPPLATGRHDLVFWYLAAPAPGDKFYPQTERSRTTVPVTMTEASRTILTIDRESTITLGEPVTVTATLADQPDREGEIAFFVDGRHYAVRPAGDEPVTVALPADEVGAHSVSASYTGTQRGEGPRSTTVSYTVTKAATSTTLTPVAGAAEGILDISVSARQSDAVPSGRVQVVNGATTVALIDLKDGSGRFVPRRMPGGEHELTFRYVGDDRTEPSSAARKVRLPALATVTQLTLDRTRSTAGATSAASVEATTTDGDPAAGTVTILVDGRTVASAELKDGHARADVPPMEVGMHAITARLNVSDAYLSSVSSTQSVVVSRASASVQRAKVKRLRSGRLRIAATITSSTSITGKVKLFQKVRVVRAHGGHRTRILRIGAAKVRGSGTRVTVVLRTKQLRVPARRVLLQYVGSTSVEAAERSIRVPRRR